MRAGTAHDSLISLEGVYERKDLEEAKTEGKAQACQDRRGVLCQIYSGRPVGPLAGVGFAPRWSMNDRWISHEEIAKRLGISRPTVADRLERGEIPGRVTHVGTQRVEREVFEKWAKSQGSVT